jgi:hypothetical protein
MQGGVESPLHVGEGYAMHFSAKGGIVLLALTTHVSLASASDSRVGVMTHFAQGWNPAWADDAAGKSITNVRDELYWANVEATPGVYTFPAFYDTYMARLKQDNISPLIELDFENPLYDGGNTPYTAAGIAAYAKYGVALLDHYGSQIQSVEVWNEYNGSFCKGPATNDRDATYTAMLKEAYTQIKAVRPDVTVVGGSTSNVALPYWAKLIADGALPYMDALSVHPYRYDSPPEGIEDDVESLQAMVKKANNGQAKPIWVTEVGWIEQATPLLVDDTTLAKYVARTYALLFSAGVERVYWYMLRDDSGVDMGLFTSAMAPKPAAYAMSTLIDELDGTPFVKKETTPDNVYSMLFQGATGKQVRIMWSMASRPISLHGVTKAVDMLGNSLGTSGAYTLSDAPIFVEGSVTGVPAPTAADEVIVASSGADFADSQGHNGWSYGYAVGSGAFTLMATYTSDAWSYYWTDNFPYLTATEIDMHPSLKGSTPVNVIRRWTSDRAGSVHVVGDFQGTDQGDGVGVSILVDGQPALARQLIGATNPASVDFDLAVGVNVGSTIDFIVDVGPGSNMNYDATAFSVQILASNPTPQVESAAPTANQVESPSPETIVPARPLTSAYRPVYPLIP